MPALLWLRLWLPDIASWCTFTSVCNLPCIQNILPPSLPSFLEHLFYPLTISYMYIICHDHIQPKSFCHLDFTPYQYYMLPACLWMYSNPLEHWQPVLLWQPSTANGSSSRSGATWAFFPSMMECILARPYTGIQSCYASMWNSHAPKDSILYHFSCFSSNILYPFPWCSLSLMEFDINVPLGAQHLTVSDFWHFAQSLVSAVAAFVFLQCLLFS